LEEQLRALKPKFIYVSGSFQSPTGYSYSLSKKKKLLKLASKYDACILEAEDGSAFTYGDGMNRDEKSLKSLDTEGRVAFMKSYSKETMPGLNIAILTHTAKTKDFREGSLGFTEVPAFVQRTFAQMLSSGDYHRHVEYVRKIFEARYEMMIRMVDEHLKPYVQYTKPQGGLNVWLKLKGKESGTEKLSNNLVRDNVLITPGAVYYVDTDYKDSPYFSLSVAGVTETQIQEGIKKIAQCLKSHWEGI